MPTEPYFQQVISILKEKKLSKDAIAKLKIKLCKQYHLPKIPTDIEILLNARKEDLPKLKHLQTKPVRSISGVAVIAVMTKPIACPHGKCIFCPGGPGSVFGDVPMSYTGKEPSTMRAIRANYDPYFIVFNRLEQYIATGHMPDKVELIIQGGTFPAFPQEYQEEVMRDCFKALNDFSDLFFPDGALDIEKFKSFFELPGEVGDAERTRHIQEKLQAIKGNSSLEAEQKRNEAAKIRCIGLTIETKPDWGRLTHGNEMLKLGCTRVELGIQSVYDNILKKTNRGHTLQDSINSIRELRDLGFKLNFHYMPGLPDEDFQRIQRQKDLQGMKELFENPDFRPDMLKIYPCLVMPGTPLEILYKKGIFQPMQLQEAAALIAEFKKYVPEYCRIMRVQRDIPTYRTLAGVERTNLRQYIAEVLKQKNIQCRCIRCREIGRSMYKNIGITDAEIKVTEYEASKGREFFLAAEYQDAVIGFCRLRFPLQCLRPEITQQSALIRELHVYGQAVPIGKEGKIQHRGFGTMLLKRAEEIATKYGKDKIVVISGIGVREYYGKLGYHLEGLYMVKYLR